MTLAAPASNDHITTAFRTLRLIDRRTSTSREVADAMAADPRLGRQVLKMARSPLCGIRTDDLTVERALVMLGFVTIRKLVVVSLCRDISEAASGDDTMDWRRALWVGISAEEFTKRIDESAASEALMVAMTREMDGSFEGQPSAMDGLTSGVDPSRIERFVGVGEAIAEMFIARQPGLPSTADLDQAIETAGMPALRDGRLAVDIRRGYDIYAGLLS